MTKKIKTKEKKIEEKIENENFYFFGENVKNKK